MHTPGVALSTTTAIDLYEGYMIYTVQDGTGTLVEPHTCIFPILKQIESDQTRLVGTGFFITTIGYFVTGKHVIFDVVNETSQQRGFLHALHFVESDKVLVRRITRVSFHNTSDVAIGKMDYHIVNNTGEPLRNRVPWFTMEPPRAESPVVTYAYPESDPVFSKGERSCFAPNFYAGHFLYHSDQPRDSVIVSWPHYATSITLMGGASGGPVFDEKGRVFAINCVGGIESLSYMARVAELLPLSVPEFPPLARDDDREYTVFELARHGKILFEPAIAWKPIETRHVGG